MVERTLSDTLLVRARRLHSEQATSRSWQEVERLILLDPELFDRCLSRASSSRYAGRSGGSGSASLWIACNLVESLERAPWCYFCGLTLTRGQFMRGDVHVEHFNPVSAEGIHEPGNVTLACRQCNTLKSSLTDEDMVSILEDPTGFFANRRWSTGRQRQICAFAEIYYPRVVGLSGYAGRHKIQVRNARDHWERRRDAYRAEWQAPN